MKIPLSTKKATAQTVASDNIIPYVVFRFHEGISICRFHELSHSSATYYLMLSDGDIKAVQGNTGHAQAGTLVNVYAHIQQNSRKKLADKFSAEFYEGEQKAHEEMPAMQNAPELTADVLLKVLQQADPVMKKQFATALFA